MGGIASSIGEVLGKEIIEGAGKFFTEEGGAEMYVRTTKNLWNKSEAGRAFADYAQNIIEPQYRKTGQAYLKANIAQKMPMRDAVRTAVENSWHDTRKALLGKNDEALTHFIYAATKERGPAYGQAVADSLSTYFHDSTSAFRRAKVYRGPSDIEGVSLQSLGIKAKAPYMNPTDSERQLNKLMGWMYTPLIAIPHTAQIGNIVLNEGFASTAKAFSEYTKALSEEGGLQASKFYNDILNHGLLFDDIRYGLLQDAQGGGLARTLFNHPGFDTVRRFQIIVSATAGKHTLLESLAELSKDSGNKWARYNIERLGTKFEEAAENSFRPTDEMITRAQHNAANQAIFLRSNLELPPMWNASFLSRQLAKYKQFGYRQGSFLGHTLVNNFRYGGTTQGLKAIAVLGTLFPVFGELVHSMEQAATLQNPLHRDTKSYPEEYLQALGYAGGLGLYYSMFRSSMWNYGRGWLEGPFFSTIEDVSLGIGGRLIKGTEALAEGDTEKAKKFYKAAAKVGLSKAGIPGRIAANLLKEDKGDF